MATKTGRKAAGRARRGATETPKKLALEVIRKLPENATLEEIKDEISILIGVEEGIRDSDAGRVISHVEMKRRMKQWLSD